MKRAAKVKPQSCFKWSSIAWNDRRGRLESVEPNGESRRQLFSLLSVARVIAAASVAATYTAILEGRI